MVAIDSDDRKAALSKEHKVTAVVSASTIWEENPSAVAVWLKCVVGPMSKPGSKHDALTTNLETVPVKEQGTLVWADSSSGPKTKLPSLSASKDCKIYRAIRRIKARLESTYKRSSGNGGRVTCRMYL